MLINLDMLYQGIKYFMEFDMVIIQTLTAHIAIRISFQQICIVLFS